MLEEAWERRETDDERNAPIPKPRHKTIKKYGTVIEPYPEWVRAKTLAVDYFQHMLAIGSQEGFLTSLCLSPLI